MLLETKINKIRFIVKKQKNININNNIIFY